MKKILLLTLCALTAQAFASESGDKEAIKKAKAEERRQALNARAAQLMQSKPKQAAKLVAKSSEIDPNNPTGLYIGACVATTSEQEQKFLAAAATSSRPSIYKDEARKALSTMNSESAMRAFINTLNEKLDSNVEFDDVTSWIISESKKFPDKDNFITNVEEQVVRKRAAWLAGISTELEKLKK